MPTREGATSTENTRKHRRVRITRFVWYQLLDGTLRGVAEGLARSCDISESGARICCPREVAPGSTIMLAVSSPELSITALGKTIWSKADNDGTWQVGIEIRAMSPNDRIALRKHCCHEEP